MHKNRYDSYTRPLCSTKKNKKMAGRLTVIVFILTLVNIGIVYGQDTGKDEKMILGGSANFLTQNNTFPLSSSAIIPLGSGIYSNSTSEIRVTTLAISPYWGMEINSRFHGAVQLTYGLRRYKSDDATVVGQVTTVDFERNSNLFGVGLFTRHIINPGGQFVFFIQPYIGYSFASEQEIQDSFVTQEGRTRYLELDVGAGLLYNINDKARLILRTGGLNFISGKWEVLDTDIGKEFNSFSSNINLATIFFGFEVRI